MEITSVEVDTKMFFNAVRVNFKKNLKNVAIIVVRYYGGTLLGAGRLLRAYVNSAVSAIEKAELIEL